MTSRVLIYTFGQSVKSSLYNNSVHIILVNLKKVKKVKVKKKLYVRTFQSKQCLVENILVKFQKHSSRSRNGNYGQNWFQMLKD